MKRRNKKKRKERKLKVYKKHRNLRATLFWIFFCIYCFGWLFMIIFAPKLLKCYGLQTEAIVTSREASPYKRWSNINCYVCEFTAENGKVYEGNSMIEVGNTDSIGKKIKICYFSFYPDLNVRKR